MFYHELTTVTAVRSTYLSVTASSDDVLLLSIIRSVCDDLARVTGRFFTPRVETRYFDARQDVAGRTLTFDTDLLAVTTLTNGDSNTIASNLYVFEPRNQTPRYALTLKVSSGVYWTYNTDPENAISILAVWGYHSNYADAWQVTGATLAANTTSSATTFTCTTGLLKAGMLLQIDSEYLYVVSVAVGASDTVTCERGANGSTAATHLSAAAINVWIPEASVSQLACECAAARYRLRDNPLADTFTALDGTVLQTPKDITAYIEKRARGLGLVRN